jgi:hypothetical protein
LLSGAFEAYDTINCCCLPHYLFLHFKPMLFFVRLAMLFFCERMSPPFALKQNQGLHFKEQGSRAETAGDLADRIEDLLDEMRRLLLRPGKAADVLPVGLMESPSPLSVSSPNCRW